MEMMEEQRASAAAHRWAAAQTRWALGVIVLAVAAGWALALPAAAAQQAGAADVAGAKPHKPRKPPHNVVYVQPEPRLPGGETRAERERRLKRECKGRPNAGACLGYAS